MIVLDTNVVSELMRAVPSATVLAWFNAQAADTLWLSSVAASELLYGVARLPEGARKEHLARAITDMLEQDFSGRILSFDLASASVYATLVARREQKGLPIAMADAQIAATCIAYGAELATRNQKHFADLGMPLINPWNGA
jgi:toxin FitB